MSDAELTNPPAPFSCSFTPNVPELFSQMKITLAISTYQAGKLLFISAQDNERLIQLPRTFRHAMAIGLDETRLAIASFKEVIVLANAPSLAPAYPNKPNTYDSFFVPRATYYTGQIDIHGLHWGSEGLWAVNTLFSCLCTIDDFYSFTPRWKPPWISALASEDRCHLNGMAMDSEGNPLYITSFNTGDEQQSWRKTIPKGGVVVHVPTNTIVAQDLPMPHSPRIYNGNLYLLLSATGELICLDPNTGEYEVIKKFDGFVRGLTKYGDYLFIGMSRLRKNSSTFKDLPIAKRARSSGVLILHLPTKAIVGNLEYKASVDEIYDIQILPGLQRPGILNTANEIHQQSLTTPNSTFWAKKPE